jgi:hypothetical protein
LSRCRDNAEYLLRVDSEFRVHRAAQNYWI